jgi:conjugative transfer signal peptidase TraF
MKPLTTTVTVMTTTALWVGGTALVATQLTLNTSASLPPGLYWTHPVRTLTPGTLVLFPAPVAVADLAVQRGYLRPATPLLKPVAAGAGTTVCVTDDGVFVEGALVAPIRTIDTEGRALPRYRGCVTLAADEVFVLGPHPQSFDSRYFGPISRAMVQATATPIWTWERHSATGPQRAVPSPLLAGRVPWCNGPQRSWPAPDIRGHGRVWEGGIVASDRGGGGKNKQTPPPRPTARHTRGDTRYSGAARGISQGVRGLSTGAVEIRPAVLNMYPARNTA